VRDRFYTMRSFVINAAMECLLLHAWATGAVPYYDTIAYVDPPAPQLRRACVPPQLISGTAAIAGTGSTRLRLP
jgi:hypothetical protein